MTYKIGILGARGYVGRELIEGILLHPELQLDWVSSRQLTGQPLTSLVPETEMELTIESLDVAAVAERDTDIIVLALPNGLAEPYATAIEAQNTCRMLLDLSADYRFDDNWDYSVPELHEFRSDREMFKISNPGCYATAMQIAIAPIRELVDGNVHCVGISGYSGAGTKPGPNNDPERLKDNILPYGLIEHIHEREVSRHMGVQVHFSPSVAEFFRGINMTVQFKSKLPTSKETLYAKYQAQYAGDNYVKVSEQVPNIQNVVNTPLCEVGGIHVSADGQRVTVISCLDNLAKGAASQAMQNINKALGLSAELGIDDLYATKRG